MKKFLVLLLTAPVCVFGQAVHQAQYGVAETFNFVLFNTDGTLDVDEVDAGTEVAIACDEGAETTATNDFVDEGNFYSIALTATELSCERATVVISATDRNVFLVETFGDVDAFDTTRGIASGMAQTTDTDASTIQLRSGHAFGDDELNGMIVCVVAGTAVNECKIITDYVGSTDEATVGPSNFTADPTTDSAYIVYPAQASTLSQMYTYFYTTQTAVDLADLQGELTALNVADGDDVTAISGAITNLTDGTTPVWVAGATLQDLVADSGTTTSLTDAALTQATNNWFRNGTRVTFTDGTLQGQSACIDTFTASTDTLTFSPPVTTEVSTHSYVLEADGGCVRGR